MRFTPGFQELKAPVLPPADLEFQSPSRREYPAPCPFTFATPFIDEVPIDPEKFEFLDRTENTESLLATNPLLQTLFLSRCFSEVPKIDPLPTLLTPVACPEPSPKPRQAPRKTGCACSKTACLRLLCRCFSSGGFCSPLCGCSGCYNQQKPEFLPIRNQAIELNKSIDKSAFSEKYKQLGEGQQVNASGCKCKVGCRNRHCSCFKVGLGCSPICRCLKCGNDRVELDQAEVRKTRLWGSRAKRKIVFVKDDGSVGGAMTPRLSQSDGFGEPGLEATENPGLTLKVESYRNKTIKKIDKLKR